MACETVLQRGKTRPNMLRARLAKAAEAIIGGGHYTRRMAFGAVSSMWRKMAGIFWGRVWALRFRGAKDDRAIDFDAKPLSDFDGDAQRGGDARFSDCLSSGAGGANRSAGFGAQ